MGLNNFRPLCPIQNSKVRRRVELCLKCKNFFNRNSKWKLKWKLLFAIALQCCYFLGTAQTKITADEARMITGTMMAHFTESVSFAFMISVPHLKILNSGYMARPFQQLQVTAWLKKHTYIYPRKSKEHIIKENDGVAVANAFKYLLDQHKNGNVIADGSELFGGKDDLENNPVAKAADCKWYQFWCLVENFANWWYKTGKQYIK